MQAKLAGDASARLDTLAELIDLVPEVNAEPAARFGWEEVGAPAVAVATATFAWLVLL